MAQIPTPISDGWSEQAATPLLEAPELARRAGVARVLIKYEGARELGNFKVLGGMYAGLRVLARGPGVRRLVCASDGNHGLAVAAAAQRGGAEAWVFLPRSASTVRAKRIEAAGGRVVWVPGTYDEAVELAAAAADRGEGHLVPDTTQASDDPVVAEVMAGYGVISRELLAQLPALRARPAHLFVQAGVGGLAAALAEGLQSALGRTIVVEPAACACVGQALAAGKPVQLTGDLHTSAEMLACGLASAPALDVLIRRRATAVAVSEAELNAATATMAEGGGLATTASGAAGLAGLLHVARDPNLRASHGLGPDAVVLLIATEAPPS